MDSNLQKKILLYDTEEVKEEYVEYTGEFQAAQRRIKDIQLWFRRKEEPNKIEIGILDKNKELIKSYKIEKIKKEKIIIWKGSQWLQPDGTYYIRVRLYPGEKTSLRVALIDYNPFLKGEYLAALSLSGAAILILIFFWFYKKRQSNKDPGRITILNIIFLAANSFFSFCLMEYIFQNHIWIGLPGQYMLYNWGICILPYVIVLLLFNSLKLSAILGNIFFLIWAMANQYVYLFKGQCLQPVDLKNIFTAANVAREYDYSLTPEMAVGISATIAVIIIWSQIREKKIVLSEKKWLRKGELSFSVFFLIGTYIILFQTPCISNLQMVMDLWDSHLTCERYGTPLSFLGYWHAMQVEKPSSYSIDKVEALADSYSEEKEKTDIETPNILVIMNEAFADLSYLGEFETNIPYLEYYNSLKENTIKGYALASIFGGGTCNSEFEFLTGHTLAFMPGSIPYAQHIQEEHASMAYNLKQQGYKTTAIHLMQKENWRRNVVYPYLGFEQFVSLEDVSEDSIKRVRKHASDESSYDEAIKVLEEKEKGEPAFIFDVTVQNHSGYVYEGDNFEETVMVNGFDSSEVNQYLSLMKISDDALGMLIKRVKEFEEPTLVVFFGDHLPRLPEEFYNWLLGDNVDATSQEVIQRKFSVPFFIWANFDIEEQDNVITSLNYLGAEVLKLAGCQLTGYDQYRLELSDAIPAINANGYIDASGTYYSMYEETGASDLLNQYWSLEYNELFDKKNKLESFFQVEEK